MSPLFSLDWKASEKTQLRLTTSAVLGARNSVLFDKPATTQDLIDPLTKEYANRQVDIDQFNSYTAESFADAFNTITPSATGSAGLVPSYHLFDFNGKISISPRLQLRLNVNNAFDKKYFTKRPQFYPGPGIRPSDGRTYSATVGVRL